MTVALVTGGNRGIGLETARQLAHRGADVLLGTRDPARGAEAVRALAADGAHVTAVPCDVTDPAGIAVLAGWITNEYGRLDVLVNNAGVIAGATAAETTVDQMRPMFEANVFGVVTTIHVLLPLLRASASPRIVNVSSTTASLTLTSDRADLPGDAGQRLGYCASKAALNMLTVQYALAFESDPELRHIKINSATPGFTATDMNGHRGLRHVSEGARAIVDLALLPANGPTGGFYSDVDSVPW